MLDPPVMSNSLADPMDALLPVKWDPGKYWNWVPPSTTPGTLPDPGQAASLYRHPLAGKYFAATWIAWIIKKKRKDIKLTRYLEAEPWVICFLKNMEFKLPR